jgi:hypothetical protein
MRVSSFQRRQEIPNEWADWFGFGQENSDFLYVQVRRLNQRKFNTNSMPMDNFVNGIVTNESVRDYASNENIAKFYQFQGWLQA